MSEDQSGTASPVPSGSKTNQLFEEGKTSYRSGGYERALALFDEALVLTPDDVDLFNWRGYTHKQLGNLENALRDFSEVIRLSPSYADAYCDRGKVLEKQGRYDAAITDYDMAISINPSGDTLLFRGFAYGSPFNGLLVLCGNHDKSPRSQMLKQIGNIGWLAVKAISVGHNGMPEAICSQAGRIKQNAFVARRVARDLRLSYGYILQAMTGIEASLPEAWLRSSRPLKQVR